MSHSVEPAVVARRLPGTAGSLKQAAPPRLPLLLGRDRGAYAAPDRSRHALFGCCTHHRGGKLGVACERGQDRDRTRQAYHPHPNLVVQPLETSVIREIHVAVGDLVHKGDVLATLDPTFSQSDVSE